MTLFLVLVVWSTTVPFAWVTLPNPPHSDIDRYIYTLFFSCRLNFKLAFSIFFIQELRFMIHWVFFLYCWRRLLYLHYLNASSCICLFLSLSFPYSFPRLFPPPPPHTHTLSISLSLSLIFHHITFSSLESLFFISFLVYKDKVLLMFHDCLYLWC